MSANTDIWSAAQGASTQALHSVRSWTRTSSLPTRPSPAISNPPKMGEFPAEGPGAGAQLCASVPPAWLGHSPLSQMLAEAELWISAIWLRVKQSRQKPWCLAVLKDWSTVPAPSVERLPSLSLQVGCGQCSPSPGYPNSSKLLFHSAPPRRSHFSQISFLQDLPQVIFIPAIPGLI